MTRIHNEWGSLEGAVMAAQRGHPRAAEYVLQEFRGMLSTRTRAYFAVGGDREDLFQVVRIALWEAMLDYRNEAGGFAAFARCVVGRRVAQAIKSWARQKHSMLNYAVSLTTSEVTEGSGLIDWAESTEIASLPSAEDDVIDAEFNRWLRELARNRTTKLEWGVIELYCLGYSQKEMAEKLKVDTKSVDNALMRIKRKAAEWSELDDTRHELATSVKKWHGNRRKLEGCDARIRP